MTVDAFLIVDEWDMLELRLRTFDTVIDRFVAVRCARTHQGQEMELADVPARFAPWAHKLFWYTVDPSMQIERDGRTYLRPPDERGGVGTPYYQHIERQHRDGCVDAVLAAGVTTPGELIMVSDVDELPSVHVLSDPLRLLDQLPAHGAFVFAQRFHSTALNLLHPQQPWLGTTLCRLRDLAPQALRDARPNLPVIPNGSGVHLSWFGTDEERQRKLDTFSHAELRGVYDPAEGRRTLTHANDERLRRLSMADMQLLPWPRPMTDGTFVPPAYWWSA